jgi:hypothetical protein
MNSDAASAASVDRLAPTHTRSVRRCDDPLDLRSRNDRTAALPEEGTAAMIDTYLLGAAGLDQDPASTPWLRAGTCLELRRNGPQAAFSASSRTQGPSRLEVRTRDGRMLGHLPPDEAQEVAELLKAGGSARVHVRGVVPAFRRPRVQLVIEVEAA